MDELNELLRPSWGSEEWILEGWNQITADEKNLIRARMDELFKNGLPFELKKDKLMYIYTFSLLAQLEVLAIQVPLKFQDKMSSPQHRQRMRVQFLDEIFHGLVFTKIVYLLCSPYAQPPAYSDSIEILCNFIRNEECPKVAVMLLNLIGEGWIEEIFYSLRRQGIAPEVFDTIINDEHRHVCEADLYQDIGLPDLDDVRPKLAYLEEQLLTNIFLQYKYMFSVNSLLGVDGAIDFLQSLHKKHVQQLEKINLKPSEHWNLFMKVSGELFPKIQRYAESNHEIEMTPIRKVFMTQWDNPSDPTMVGEFNMNISCIDFFGKKFPPETITILMMQAISLGISETASFRSFLNHKTLYQSKESYVGLIVKLPDCGDHIGTIVFENCHLNSLPELSARIRNVMKMMVYCYKKRELLETQHPHLKTIIDNMLYDFANDLYDYPMPGNSVVSLSNIGFCGYSQTKSPLRVNEAIKFTLLEVERRPVWNKKTNSFEPQDIMPVSISADHRIFDGNLPVPKITVDCFERTFAKMQNDLTKPIQHTSKSQEPQLVKTIDRILEHNLEAGYKALLALQTYWVEFLRVEDILSKEMSDEMTEFFS
ncbi:2-oxo acid dehydrogenase subunit E2 [Legionella spiritensis]|uniref:Putative CoA-dependent acyltransferase n=1 Tax=Legionella spiritensis TaxID=452 RepID=A0A0W0Z8Z4_LEGSP|nr:2-oxo acid dehydrogenase subunit E2 [Legionella spiritensis]KTD65254.1 putative CoA-dependent acyltransferase [Legionella spiritensis]SNV30269.1 putative CoA-dependent acyltransferase [Legionella spiritensis]VEG91891.1 putative CoA-dependent acyltransferase [Legionella spiritensis]